LDGELVHYLPTITAHLRDAVSKPLCGWHYFSPVILVFFLCHVLQFGVYLYFSVFSLYPPFRLLHAGPNPHSRHWFVLETLQKPWGLLWNLLFAAFWMLCSPRGSLPPLLMPWSR
jgi:hypothetical protein